MALLDTNKIRKDYPIFGRRAEEGFVFLDSAASSLTPAQVVDSVRAHYEECRSNVHRGMYRTSLCATAAYEEARAKVADFIGASAEEVVFTSGTTASLNMLARSLGHDLGSDDEVVLTIMDHHANIVPWQKMAEKQGFTLKYLPLGDDYQLDQAAARTIIGPKTKVVSAIWTSNVLGCTVAIKELIRIAHDHGALVVIDAAQTVAHERINVGELDCDYMAFSGHKMYGPTGTGVLYGKRALLEDMEPSIYGGGMIVEVTKDGSIWAESPHKFEAGTPNIAGAIGLGSAVDYLEEIGMERITAHLRDLTTFALEKLSSVKGLKIFGPEDGGSAGIISFEVDGIHSHDMTDLLAGLGICVRGGHHCAMPLMRELELPGTTRASLGIYNDREDVERLVGGIEEVRKTFIV